MAGQEKIDVFVKNFLKLDEDWKGYIQKLTQDLAEIHGEGEFLGEFNKGDAIKSEKRVVYPALTRLY
jgi:hypothetical protein